MASPSAIPLVFVGEERALPTLPSVTKRRPLATVCFLLVIVVTAVSVGGTVVVKGAPMWALFPPPFIGHDKTPHGFSRLAGAAAFPQPNRARLPPQRNHFVVELADGTFESEAPHVADEVLLLPKPQAIPTPTTHADFPLTSSAVTPSPLSRTFAPVAPQRIDASRSPVHNVTAVPSPSPHPSISADGVATCVRQLPKYCNNHGTETCRWVAHSKCDIRTNLTNLADAAAARRVVFHGDSTLREIFQAYNQRVLHDTRVVTKSESNMTSRAVITSSTEMAAFRFDYHVHHLTQPIKSFEPTEEVNGPAAVVFGLGLYHARSIARNATMFVNPVSGATEFTPGTTLTVASFEESIVANMERLSCGTYRTPLAVFMGTWMECAPLKNGVRAKKARLTYSECVRERSVLRLLNQAVQSGLEWRRLEQATSTSARCDMVYVDSITCSSLGTPRNPCTRDAVHSRPGGNYAVAKMEVLLQSLSVARVLG